MNDKKTQIVQAAIKLFGERDYHSTSVQDIVSLAGVSKGAFYLHFHSKEELLVHIFNHYMESFRTYLDDILQDPSLSARDRLFKAIEYQCESIIKDKDFISMQLKGITFLNKALQNLMIEQSNQTVIWIEQRIIEFYGTEIKPHSFDCANLFNGMIKEYFFCHIIFGYPIEGQHLSEYLMNRLDDIIYGILSKPTTPILCKSFNLHDCSTETTRESLIERALNIKDWIEAHVEPPSVMGTMLQSLEVIIQEAAKAEPNEIIIKGMVNYLCSLADDDTGTIAEFNKSFRDI
ncbi:transcriptional regulator, TetR family [Paenibacillus sp. 1_12]|uniref:TetR/AcrR family transcriptional regulator n=1 Tax=Paenibacillus sp. 1_12 TaxID=1566278 RepID=UPI0008EB46AA|nr:TetR/AcrR family transcriptional regulator [Paenibacillus sp. 1_12]SFL38326.1 transcriptional regulator, TetR family [Paenibacillus sp. 1_12]